MDVNSMMHRVMTRRGAAIGKDQKLLSLGFSTLQLLVKFSLAEKGLMSDGRQLSFNCQER